MDEPTKKPHGIGWYPAWTVLVLVLYVAGWVPTYVLNCSSHGTPQAFWAIIKPVYRPLVFALRVPAINALQCRLEVAMDDSGLDTLTW